MIRNLLIEGSKVCVVTNVKKEYRKKLSFVLAVVLQLRKAKRKI